MPRRTLLSPEELTAALPAHWTALAGQITRTYPFITYRAALTFTVHLAEDAETHDHHPDLLLRYRDVTVTFSTHDRGGVTAVDLAAAVRADTLYAAPTATAQPAI